MPDNGISIEYNRPDSSFKANTNVFGLKNGQWYVVDANIKHKRGQANLNADLNSFNFSAQLPKDKTPIANIEGDISISDLAPYALRFVLPNDWYFGTPEKGLNINISKKH